MGISLTRSDLELAGIGSPGGLGAALDQLASEGHVYDESLPFQANARYVRISRTYLWLLGYLRKDNGKDERDSDYVQGLQHFLRDLGRPQQAGQLDEAAWVSLRALVSFDTQTNVSQWLTAEELSPAFVRAVHLRLFSYGLVASPPSPKPLRGTRLKRQDKRLQEGITDFVRMASYLRLADAELSPGWNDPVLSLLFSHEKLLDRLASGAESIEVYPQHSGLALTSRKIARLTRNFIGNLALVELWLLGYDVRPGNFRVDGAHGREGGGSYRAAMQKFIKDRDLKSKVYRSVDGIVWFFREARNILAAPSAEAPIPDEQLNELVSNKKYSRKLAKEYRSLGARILDGITRVVKWFSGLIRRLFRRMTELFRNLARIVFRAASEIYLHFRAMIEVTAKGFHYVFAKTIPGSSWQAVHIQKQADFDMQVVVHPAPDQQRADDFFRALNLRVRALEVGGKVLDLFIRIVSNFISVGQAALGWIGLLLALVKLSRMLKSSVELARESYAIVEEFRVIDAQDGVVTA